MLINGKYPDLRYDKTEKIYHIDGDLDGYKQIEIRNLRHPLHIHGQMRAPLICIRHNIHVLADSVLCPSIIGCGTIETVQGLTARNVHMTNLIIGGSLRVEEGLAAAKITTGGDVIGKTILAEELNVEGCLRVTQKVSCDNIAVKGHMVCQEGRGRFISVMGHVVSYGALAAKDVSAGGLIKVNALIPFKEKSELTESSILLRTPGRVQISSVHSAIPDIYVEASRLDCKNVPANKYHFTHTPLPDGYQVVCMPKKARIRGHGFER